MGQNLSVGGTPVSITLDSFVSELGPSFNYERGLGKSTRFLKTIRAKHADEGPVVVKLFVKPPDQPGLPLKRYENALNDLKERTENSGTNVLPYQQLVETDKAVYLIRQFISTNLYDRISTRPFLNLLERKWIAFQLLCAVTSIHSKQVYHGDIKTENVLVTSWNWVFLTDFAPFKPVYLPEDDPADFTYFFDASLRRCCYLAPERFHNSDKLRMLNDLDKNHIIEPSMDIFSLGCVIAELFLEGTPIFTLSQLLRYRSNDYDPSKELENIECREIRELILHMIQLDPKARLSAGEYLEKWKHVFPAYFHSFLHQYMISLEDTLKSSSPTANQPFTTNIDGKIYRLFNDFDKIAYFLQFEITENVLSAKRQRTIRKQRKSIFPLDTSIPNYQIPQSSSACHQNGSILLPVISSCLRNLKRPSFKVMAIELYNAVAPYTSDEDKLDRVLPYLITMLSDRSASVRSAAIKSITHLLNLVWQLPDTDVDLFPEYILPHTKLLASDPEVSVRLAYAQCIGTLAEVAMRFLEMEQSKLPAASDTTPMAPELEQVIIKSGSIDLKISELRAVLQEDITSLLIDQETIVKRALMQDIGELCMFFGKSKSSDVLLSHMITYLNDKDWQLRAIFFESIVTVGTFVGGRSLEQFILPLILQSLYDLEYLVVEKVLSCLKSLLDLLVFSKVKIRELIALVSPLLIHPAPIVRAGTISLITSSTKRLSAVENFCFIRPVVCKFLKLTSTCEISEETLTSFVMEPISWNIYHLSIQIAEKCLKGSPVKIRDALQPQKTALFDEAQFFSMLNEHDIPRAEMEKVILMLPYLSKLVSTYIKSHSWQPSSDKLGGSMDPEFIHDFKNLQVALQTVFLTPPKAKLIQPGTPESKVRNLNSRVNTLKIDDIPREPSESNISQNESMVFGDLFSDTASVSTNVYNKPSKEFLLSQLPQRCPASVSTSSTQVVAHLNPQSSTNQRSKVEPSLFTAAETLISAQSAHDLQKVNTSPVRKPVIERDETVEDYDYKQGIMEKNAILAFPPSIDAAGARVNPPSTIRNRTINPKNYNIPSIERWKPQGLLISHFTEHQGKINQIALSPDHLFFVTCSDDHTARVWDCQRLEKNVTNRSRTIIPTSGKALSLCFLENTHTIAISSDSGSIEVMRIDCIPMQNGPPKYGRPQSIKCIQLENENAVLLDHYNTDLESVLVFATTKGNVYGRDLRTDRILWKIVIPFHFGAITALAIDKKEKSWLTVGTHRGVISAWDVRFQIPINSWVHPSQSIIHKLSPYFRVSDNESESTKLVMCSTNGNELSLWDIGQAECLEVYCAREIEDKLSRYLRHYKPVDVPLSTPPDDISKLQTVQVPEPSFRSFYRPLKSNYLISAGSDRKIRYWDLANVEKSFIVSGGKDGLERQYSLYKSDTNISLLLERCVDTKQSSDGRSSQSSTPQHLPSTAPLRDDTVVGHSDSITDLVISEVPFPVLITVSRDGLIKAWK